MFLSYFKTAFRLLLKKAGSAKQALHLVEAPVPHNLGQHFAIRVGDLDAVVRELRSKHIQVADPMTTGANRQTFINDPAGNAIELHQVGASVPSLS